MALLGFRPRAEASVPEPSPWFHSFYGTKPAEFQQPRLQQMGTPMLQKERILEVIRRMDIAVRESEEAAQEARAQLARIDALLSQIEEWRKPVAGRNAGSPEAPVLAKPPESA